MLKHVQISPLRNRSDSLSLRSTTSCASSMCGSPEPPTDLQRTPSRASSYSSLNEQLPQTTIKVFTNCLKIDIEYKTLGIQWDTTSKEVITQLLRRLKMRHRDPRLFYLSMEVSVRRAGVKTILVLDDDTRPAILQACHPKGESRFCLQLKPGGLIRVHTSALQPSSQYKSLVISEETTSDELLQLLLSCYNSVEPVEQFSLYEVCPGQEYQRKLHPDDIPLRAQAERMKRGETCHFLVRRNPNYARRRQLLAALEESSTPNEQKTSSLSSAIASAYDGNNSLSSLDDTASLLDMSIESISYDLHSLMTSDEDEDCSSSTSCSSDNSSKGSTTVYRMAHNLPPVAVMKKEAFIVCPKCRNNYKSCEFCHKNSSMIVNAQAPLSSCSAVGLQKTVHMHSSPAQYNPVYNIREIRTVSNSFSSLGNDKKFLDIQLSGRFDSMTAVAAFHQMRPQSMIVGHATRMVLDANSERGQRAHNDVNANKTAIGVEAVNNNPSQGLGHYVYL